MASTSGALTGTPELTLFVSYARADAAFADRLVGALTECGFQMLIDRRDLPLLEEWKRELLRLVEDSDTVLFIVSPRSLASIWCAWEIEQVLELRKRLAPVLLEPVIQDPIPEAISKLQLVRFTPDRDFDAEVRRLAHALRTDVPWIREHTRLGSLARRWHARSKPSELLLRGRELEEAELWAARRPIHAPATTWVRISPIVNNHFAAS